MNLRVLVISATFLLYVIMEVGFYVDDVFMVSVEMILQCLDVDFRFTFIFLWWRGISFELAILFRKLEIGQGIQERTK